MSIDPETECENDPDEVAYRHQSSDLKLKNILLQGIGGATVFGIVSGLVVKLISMATTAPATIIAHATTVTAGTTLAAGTQLMPGTILSAGSPALTSALTLNTATTVGAGAHIAANSMLAAGTTLGHGTIIAGAAAAHAGLAGLTLTAALPWIGLAAIALIGIGCIYFGAKYYAESVRLDNYQQAKKINQGAAVSQTIEQQHTIAPMLDQDKADDLAPARADGKSWVDIAGVQPRSNAIAETVADKSAPDAKWVARTANDNAESAQLRA